MNYFLFKLAFDSAVHFGGADSALSLEHSEMNFRADTLFSALCHAAISLQGEEGVQELCRQVQQGELLLSDAMPWQGEDFYLPKPLAVSDSRAEVPSQMRKKIKRMAWLPVMELETYVHSLHKETYEPEEVSFGRSYEQTKAAVPEGRDAMPYPVGLYRFAPDCGLYFICACQKEEQADWLGQLLEALGMGGIGGKTSAGYGRFHLDDQIYLNEPFDDQTEWLQAALQAKIGPWLMLTTSLPREDEMERALDGANFRLVRRGGFVASEQLSEGRKKQAQYFLEAGSVLQNPYEGELYSVCPGAPHPVYRYAKPLFLGVKL